MTNPDPEAATPPPTDTVYLSSVAREGLERGAMYLTPFERAYEQLEKELDKCETEEQRKAVRQAMREMEREEADRQRWEEEGEFNGWR